MKAQLPCAVLRIDSNLEAAPLTRVLQAAEEALEGAREFIVEVLGEGDRTSELVEEVYKPIINELARRRAELAAHPQASRGNA